MSQGKGAMMQLVGQREPSFRTAPVSPDAILLPFTKYGLVRDPQKVKDPSVSGSPLPGKSAIGDILVKGPIESIFDLRTIGFHLAMLLGVPTQHKAVTKQPTNITGVTVHYAKTATPAGNGTLDFIASATTLSWKAGTETEGTPVNVSAGGRFTLASGTANHDVVVEVDATALPITDKTDADIAVSTTLKCHVFPFNLDDRPSALFELGHPDISKFYRTVGAKLSKISYDVTAPEQNVSLDYLAGAESEENAAWDATPTAYDSVRAVGLGGFLGNGSSAALGEIAGGNFSADIQAEGKKIANQQAGYGYIQSADAILSGNLQVLFNGLGAYSLARNATSTRLRIGSSAATAAGTFSLWWDMPNVELTEKSEPKEGKSGLLANLDWMAHRSVFGALPMVTLINDVPSY